MILAYLITLLVSLSAKPDAVEQEAPRAAASIIVARSSMVNE